MRRFLTVLFIIGMLFTGGINLAEARHDVYVTKEDNWVYYVTDCQAKCNAFEK